MRISDWSSDVCSSDLLAAARDVRRERFVAPEMAQRGGRGDEGVVVAAEGAVVLARRPSVEFGAEQGQREGQAHARQRLRLGDDVGGETRSEEHTSELQSLMRISFAVFCLKKKI